MVWQHLANVISPFDYKRRRYIHIFLVYKRVSPNSEPISIFMVETKTFQNRYIPFF